ncbi:YhdP family protein [Stutzerimonas marianensis]|uniref:YhdP family protein n=1 Tax=Stutzerimonas marianensis TaxID=2929513 RepID=UPI003C2EFE0A
MSRLPALMIALSRRCLWLAAVGLILAAFYVSLGRQLVPWVAEYRAEAESKAQELLRMPVTLGRLEGRWEGFRPRLVARDVQLGEGDEAVRLDSLAVVPDLAESLWSRTLQLASVTFSGVHLSVVEGAEGGWRLSGMPERDGAPPLSPEQLLARLRSVEQLRLHDSQVTFQPQAGAPLTLSYVDVELRSLGDGFELDGRMLLPDGKPLALRADAQWAPARWEDVTARLYLSLPQSDWAAWLPTSLVDGLRVGQLQGGGEIWLDWRERGVARAVARLNLPKVDVGPAEREMLGIDDLALNAYLDRQPQGYRLQLDGLSFDLGDSRWPEMRVLLSQDAEADRWQLQADRVPLATLARLVEGLAPLPDMAQAYLEALAPEGTLRNLQLGYRPRETGAERLTFAGNLDAVGIDAYHWIPAVHNVNGLVRGDLGAGELRFDNQDFSLHLAELFAEPWRYRTSRGSLRWTFDEEAFTLVAPYLQVEGEEGQIAGDFLIRLMRDPGLEDYMDLRVGIRNGDAAYTARYLPTRSPALSAPLAEWLQTAIRGGTVEQGYFEYQGSIARDAAEEARSLGLYFKVRDAELAFQPGWPVLREAHGEVLIEDSGVRVRLADGRMLDSRVHDARAQIPRRQGGGVPRLSVQGAVEGNVRDALTLLQVAPIGTADLVAGWTGDGPLTGELDLDIPLAKGETPKAKVDFNSRDASLYIAQADLAFDAVAGTFRYDTERGLSGQGIQARSLGAQWRGSASATGQPGAPATRIQTTGRVAIQALLDWQKIERPLPITGELPLQLALSLGGGDNQLQLDSSLIGARLDLPAPFAKSADERRDTTLRLSLGGEQQRLSLKHGELATLAFGGPTGRLLEGGGELVLGGGAANRRSDAGLYVRGNLATLDAGQWGALRESFGQPAEDAGAVSLLRRAQLNIGRFEGFGTRVEALGVDLRRQAAGWSLALDSETIAGEVQLPDSTEPITLNLSHLRLPAPAPADAGAEPRDPLAGVDPSGVPAMDVSIGQVYQGSAALGPWSLKLRPAAGGVAFSDLNLGLRGINLTGEGGWAGDRTWYKGGLAGANLADVLLAWGFAPSTTSESFSLTVDGRWPGSPAFFGFQRLSGALKGSLRKGQLREVDGSAQALRVFGLLNFDSIGRRLRLDFSDLFSKGLSYDRITADLQATDGLYVTREPLKVTGPSSNLELQGQLDMANDRIDAKLLVTLPVSNNLPLAALIVGAPAIGGALFVADKLLGDRVARFATVQYRVEGPWQAPQITFDRPFENPN